MGCGGFACGSRCRRGGSTQDRQARKSKRRHGDDRSTDDDDAKPPTDLLLPSAHLLHDNNNSKTKIMESEQVDIELGQTSCAEIARDALESNVDETDEFADEAPRPTPCYSTPRTISAKRMSLQIARDALESNVDETDEFVDEAPRPTPYSTPRTVSAKRMSLPVTSTPSRPSRRRLMSGDRPSSKMLRKRTANNLQTTTHTTACTPSSSYDSQLNKLDVQTASAIIDAPPAPTLRSIRRTSCGLSTVRPKAVRFAARMSAALTLSSLFWLIPGYPQGTWVYITALMVCWFPAMDAASVIKKTIQRIQGTIMGAILGLLVGFFSFVIDTNQGRAKQAVFLGVMIALVTFLYTFLFVQYRYIASHSYAGLVALMTFAIALEPFYVEGQGSAAWNKALLRIANVIIGCIIGGIVSLVVFPKSTKGLVKEKLVSQINLAGEASQAVMVWSAKVFGGQGAPAFLGSVLTECRNSGDIREGEDDEDDVAAYNAYNKAIKQWKDTKSLFPLMQYDAGLHCAKKLGVGKHEAEFNKKAAIVLARAFRLQTTAVLLHSIARNDQGHDFSEDELNTFSFIGHLIGSLLHCPFSEDAEAIADDLLNQLVFVREFAIDEAVDVAEAARATSNGDASSMTLMRDALRLRLANGEGNMPLSLYSSDNSSLLFLQLVEHLCLRALRLYYASKELLGENEKSE